MAKDPKTDFSKIDLRAVKEYAKIIRQAKGDVEKLSLYEQSKLQAAKDYLTTFKDLTESKQQSIELDRQIKEINEGIVDLNKQKARLKTKFKEEDKLKLAQLTLEHKALKAIKKTKGEIRDISRLVTKAEEFSLKIGQKTITHKKIQLDLERKLMEMKGKKAPGDLKEAHILNLLSNSLTGMVKAGPQVFEDLKKISLETAGLSLLIPGLGMDKIRTDLLAMPAAMDKSRKEIVKGGFQTYRDLDEIFMTILDPINSANDEFATITKQQASQLYSSILLGGPEVKEALFAVKTNVSLARKDWIEFSEENRFAAISMGSTTAALKKLGVAEGDTTKTLDFFIRSMKQTPAIAEESVRRLTNMAKTLDINVGTAFKDFISLQGELSQYGSRTIDVFAELQAQATATGIEVGKLSKVATTLDTFKGAAKAAQGFNAVMGKTVLSVTDLVHAEPAEKIELMKDAMDRSGMSFDTANRRIRSIIASLMGVDVAEAGRIFGSSTDYFELSDGMDTTAESVESLKKRVDASFDAGERALKMQSNLGRGMDQMLTRAYSSADELNTLMLKLFTTVRGGTNTSEEAFVSYLGYVVTAGTAVRAAKGAAHKILGVGAGAAVMNEIINALGGGAVSQGVLNQIEKRTKTDFIGSGPDGPTVGPDGFYGDPKDKVKAVGVTPGAPGAPAAGDPGLPGGQQFANLAPPGGGLKNLTIELKTTEGKRITEPVTIELAGVLTEKGVTGKPFSSLVEAQFKDITLVAVGTT